MIVRVIVFLNSTVIDTVTEVSTNLCVDCEQSLFFFRFSRGNVRARERWAEKPRDARNEGASSRAISHARGQLRVSGVLLDGPRKKRDCSQSNLCGSESSSELKWVNNYLPTKYLGHSSRSNDSDNFYISVTAQNTQICMNYKQKHFKTSRKQYWMAYCYIKQLEKELTPEKKKNRKKE